MYKDVVDLFHACSNDGRWGHDDELGTLNLITADVRKEAAGHVRLGRTVSLSRAVDYEQSATNPRPAWHVMHLPNHDFSTNDSLALQIHGHSTTHIDALGHMFWEGVGYNGRRQADVVSSRGLQALDVDVMKEGIFTRGVFLDVANAAGVNYLQPTDTVTRELLERAAELGGDEVRSGDAVFVHTGLERRVLVEGEEDPTVRCGLDADSVRWLRERDISVYSGDCIEKLPSVNGRVKLPLHQIGIASMGLAILDCVSLTELYATCTELGRSSFLLVVAPLRIPGATGSPVNPLAVF